MKNLFVMTFAILVASSAQAETYKCRVLMSENSPLVDVSVKIDSTSAAVSMPERTFSGAKFERYINGQMQSRRALSQIIWFSENSDTVANNAEYMAMVKAAELARETAVTADSINVGSCDDGCIATVMNHKDSLGQSLLTTVLVGWGAVGTCSVE